MVVVNADRFASLHTVLDTWSECRVPTTMEETGEDDDRRVSSLSSSSLPPAVPPPPWSSLLRIRTITGYVTLRPTDFAGDNHHADDHDDDVRPGKLGTVLASAVQALRRVQHALEDQGYEVQTLRLATNPFGEWLRDDDEKDDHVAWWIVPRVMARMDDRLQQLDVVLSTLDVDMMALGAAQTSEETHHVCPRIIMASPRFSCAAVVAANDVVAAHVAAETVQRIAWLGGMPPTGEGTAATECDVSPGDPTTRMSSTQGPTPRAPPHVRDGVGNFRFAVVSRCCTPYIPFFPAAAATSVRDRRRLDTTPDEAPTVPFALGFENGRLLQHLVTHVCHGDLGRVSEHLTQALTAAYTPVQRICKQVVVAALDDATKAGGPARLFYQGMDTSFNPSLEPQGSVAAALELFATTTTCGGPFGGPGALAAAAALTTCAQHLPGLRLTGYCGLMLPVCEDERLVELTGASDSSNGTSITSSTSTTGVSLLRVADLLNISHVCGVGIDTVPLPGDCSVADLTALLLDMTALSERWSKPLSCRVFPVPGKGPGERTAFDSPHLQNAHILSLSHHGS